ncbi:MAG: hypothetical protein JW863_00635 [Chitinispirillaceae bacterium]|nr:hypothetical protein [Chitinispirillaceae bacterium]
MSPSESEDAMRMSTDTGAEVVTPDTTSFPAASSGQQAETLEQQPASSGQTQDQQSTEDEFVKKGIGVQCGIRFHNPKSFNNFVTEYWRSFLAGYVYGGVDKKKIGPGLFFMVNGTIDIGTCFHVTPYVGGMWAGKQFSFHGDLVNDLHVNTLSTLGGLDLWVRIVNGSRVTLRLGAGGFGAYTNLYFSDDNDEFKLSGSGYGFRGLVGTEVRVTDRVVVTLDCRVPYGLSNLYDKGQKDNVTPPVDYPTKFEHVGFELSPGVMFYF